MTNETRALIEAAEAVMKSDLHDLQPFACLKRAISSAKAAEEGVEIRLNGLFWRPGVPDATLHNYCIQKAYEIGVSVREKEGL